MVATIIGAIMFFLPIVLGIIGAIELVRNK
jgi:hypothetical protein